MKKLNLVFLLSLLMLTINGYSQESDKPLKAKFLIDVGAEYGGEEILKVVFTNGDEQSMRAGQGGYLAVGGQFQFSNFRILLLRASIGIKYTTTAADDANIRLTRIPINIMPYWMINDDFRLGVGVTTHQNIKFKGDGFISDIDFTSSLGPRFEFGYKWVALTYTIINYKTKTNEQVFSANSVGISLSLTLPNN